MSDFSKATPRPWTAHGPIVFMYDEGGFDLRNCPEPEANAALIVEAVNAYDAQAALIAELVEELDAVRIIAAQAHRNYGNIGKETTFLLIIEERAAAALAKAKAVQPKIDLAGIHGQHEMGEL
jgi:hypothetical protein